MSSYHSEADRITGYQHPCYAQSFAEWGTPRELARCGGWLLEREIAGFAYRDAMGCYPLFSCRDWSQLPADLDELTDNLVSVALVADPYGTYAVSDLEGCFDVVVPFKEHFVAEFTQPVDEFVSRRHRRRACESLEKLRVEKCEEPMQFVDEWTALYAALVETHGLKGIKAFSRSAFARQLSVPGMVAFRAVTHDGGVTVGAHLYYVQGSVAYCHLAAFSALGYELMASFALQWYGLQYFADKVERLGLGAGAGVASSDGTDGLSQFKRGWANGTRTAYFCGRILDRARYAQIVDARRLPPTDYFPAYRKGELG